MHNRPTVIIIILFLLSSSLPFVLAPKKQQCILNHFILHPSITRHVINRWSKTGSDFASPQELPSSCSSDRKVSSKISVRMVDKVHGPVWISFDHDCYLVHLKPAFFINICRLVKTDLKNETGHYDPKQPYSQQAQNATSKPLFTFMVPSSTLQGTTTVAGGC